MTAPKVTKVKSGSLFEDKESYSRLVVVDNWIFAANTAGRNYKTREMSTDAVEQARQCFANIEGALASVGASLADVVRSSVIIHNREDAAAVMAVVGEKFRGIDPASTVTCSPLGAPDFKVEIEITAYKGVGAAGSEYIKISL